MPWIETTLRQGYILDDLFNNVFRTFKDPEGKLWWPDFYENVPKVDLYKVTFNGDLFKLSNGQYTPNYGAEESGICITRHIIIRRWDNQILGFAVSTGEIKIVGEDLLKGNTLYEKIFNLYEEYVDNMTLYAYTMDNYFGPVNYLDEEGNMLPALVICQDTDDFGLLRLSLDVEYFGSSNYYPDTFQSPIVEMKLKGDTGESVEIIDDIKYKTNTNWWKDSLVQLMGYFDEKSCFFTLRVDTAPIWEDNVTPVIPFFFGDIVTDFEKKGLEETVALFGGTQVDKDFDFDDTGLKTREVIQPVTRNYVSHPSNGIDSVIVKRTKHGARYQSHYISANVPPYLMPPDRQEVREDGVVRKYPRAWNYMRDGYYQYDFKVSKYSKKIHASKAYVVHPEDGKIGYLPNILVIPTINVRGGDILKHPVRCTGDGNGKEPYNVYYTIVIEGSSPLTKRPSSHYRPLAVAVLQNPYYDEQLILPNEETPASPTPEPKPEIPEDGMLVECGNKVEAGENFAEFYYDIPTSGIVYIEYDFYSAKDNMRVYIGDRLVHETGMTSHEKGSPFGFNYDPSMGRIKVTLNEFEGRSGTAWEFVLYCPGQAPQEVVDKAVIVG